MKDRQNGRFGINYMNKLSNFYKNKRVLITGHTGFKGAWLTKILLNWGSKVSGIALEPPTKPNLFEILDFKKEIKNNIADIRNFEKVKNIIQKEKPEIIFHLAAQPMVREGYVDPLYTYETNILGTANILEAIRTTNSTKAALIITTDKVYENYEKNYHYKEEDKLGGYDPYSASKASAEIVTSSYIRSFFNPTNKKTKTFIASARAGNVIGGGDWGKDRLVPDFVKAMFANSKLVIRSPKAVRPWQFVLEPLYGYLLLAHKLYEGKKEFSGAWNFGPNKNNYLEVEGVIKKAIISFNKEKYTIKKDDTKHEANILKLNSNKSKELLNWKSVFSLDQTLDFTFKWYNSFYQGKDIKSLTDNQISEYIKEYEN